MMSNILFQHDATLVRWAVDGQYLPAHLDFDHDPESDTSKVTRGIFELLRECAVSFAERKG